MEENKEKPTELVQNWRNPDGTLKKGHPDLGAGRPKGSEDFKTKWFKFIDKVAEANGTTSEDIEHEIFKTGLKKVRSGDFNFYKYTHDRLYGKATQVVDIKGDIDIKKISDEEANSLLKLLDPNYKLNESENSSNSSNN